MKYLSTIPAANNKKLKPLKKILLSLMLMLPLCALAQQKTDTPLYLMPAFGTDTTRQLLPKKSALELLWEQQTVGGQNAITEKATAGFYSTGAGAGVYAFHDTAPRGSVLRVKNLNNDRVIYVKVLAPIPVTKQFKGCTLGLTNSAKAALGAHDAKIFCEISYMGY